MLLFNRKSKKSFFHTTDFIAPLVPLGLAFGRIGNYINAELWGRVTTSAWSVYSPDQSGMWAQRYPTQLFEALLEGVVLFVFLWLFSQKNRPLMAISSLFLIFYGFFRFIIEFIRVPDSQLGYLAFEWLTMGQLLSFPMFVIGLYLFYRSYYSEKKL
jgi:phosphatidylglycerol:prolipoprotein diacylglycerol transferase